MGVFDLQSVNFKDILKIIKFESIIVFKSQGPFISSKCIGDTNCNCNVCCNNLYRIFMTRSLRYRYVIKVGFADTIARYNNRTAVTI